MAGHGRAWQGMTGHGRAWQGMAELHAGLCFLLSTLRDRFSGPPKQPRRLLHMKSGR